MKITQKRRCCKWRWSCYAAGRDGFWLHRHLRSIGIQNEVIDAASIQANRRLRPVKTDRLDGDAR